MNNNPLFSVLIANYNNKNYLEECVNSVLCQTYANWEIIIVDDFSTDNPDEIYNSLVKNSRIKVYMNEQNRKTAYTFSKALSRSKGEICGFLGPDDTLEKTALEKTIKKHLQFPECGIVYTLNYICDHSLNIIELTKWGGMLPSHKSQLTASAGEKITSFATFKKNIFERTEGINSKFTRAFDQDFYFKMEEVAPICFINEPLYFYRIHNRNISLNENHAKAWYWSYIASKDAYFRRKKGKIKIPNITFSILQRRYLKVCLLKIDEKLRTRKYRNILYYYFQISWLFFWDKNFLIFKAHVFFIKRILLRNFRSNYEDFALQYN